MQQNSNKSKYGRKCLPYWFQTGDGRNDLKYGSARKIREIWQAYRLEFFENNFTVRLPDSQSQQHYGSIAKGTTPRNFGRNRGWVCKKWLLAYKISNISETRQERTNRTCFRLVSKSMTLDDLEGSLCTLFQNVCVFYFGAHHENLNEDRSIDQIFVYRAYTFSDEAPSDPSFWQ